MKIKLFVNTGFAGCKHEDIDEVDDQEWNEMTEEQKEKYIDEVALEFMNNKIEYGAYPIEDEDE